jgi:hypothetical protein
LFIVARSRPDILERVRERLLGDERIEVIVDRRYGERRREDVPREPERRAGDRRRRAKAWDDLTLFPTLVAQKRVPSYAQLERNAAAYARECQQLREVNDCLRAAMASLEARLEAVISADAASKADTIAILSQAEDAVGSLIARLRALTS